MDFDVRIPQGEIDKLGARLAINPGKLRDVSFFMLQQVEDRFRTQGASGGVPWKPKKIKEWGADDGRAILTGRSGILRKSYTAVSNDKQAIVGTWVPYAVTHQVGATIKPKKARALFIPLTDRAANSVRFIGKEAGKVRLMHRLPELLGPYRAGTKSSQKTRAVTFVKLVKGRLKNGRLQGWDDRRQEWSDSKKPDFMFLMSAKIPARPMLPVSPREVKATAKFFVERLLKPDS